jgi:hypothetical protein
MPLVPMLPDRLLLWLPVELYWAWFPKCWFRGIIMGNLVKQSLTLMWQGMGAIFIVITLIYIVMLIFPKIFKDK